MAKKETMREKIARLEAENAKLKETNNYYLELLNDADKRIAEYSAIQDNNFKNSSYYKQLLRDIETQTMRADTYKKQLDYSQKIRDEQVDKLEGLQKLIIKQNKKNPRGAGRKQIFDEQDQSKVLTLRQQGKNLKEIASEMGCSIATISNYLHRFKN